jgi:hypothetical protein
MKKIACKYWVVPRFSGNLGGEIVLTPTLMMISPKLYGAAF